MPPTMKQFIVSFKTCDHRLHYLQCPINVDETFVFLQAFTVHFVIKAIPIHYLNQCQVSYLEL